MEVEESSDLVSEFSAVSSALVGHKAGFSDSDQRVILRWITRLGAIVGAPEPQPTLQSKQPLPESSRTIVRQSGTANAVPSPHVGNFPAKNLYSPISSGSALFGRIKDWESELGVGVLGQSTVAFKNAGLLSRIVDFKHDQLWTASEIFYREFLAKHVPTAKHFGVKIQSQSLPNRIDPIALARRLQDDRVVPFPVSGRLTGLNSGPDRAKYLCEVARDFEKDSYNRIVEEMFPDERVPF